MHSFAHVLSPQAASAAALPCSARAGAIILAFSLIAVAAGQAAEPAKISVDEATQIGIDAYIYGYPLVTMETTRRVMTNVAKPEGKLAPMGQFASLRAYPSPADKEVTAPNADTLYSLAWLDLSKQPYVLSIPDEGDRYFLLPMLSGWTDVFQSPGKRTTGTKAQAYLVTGPGWKGTVPKGLTQYKSPTSLVWILGRTYCTGTPEDYQAVHAIQDKYSLVPLDAYGKPYTPPQGKVDPSIDMKTPVREQVNLMQIGPYFKILATLLKNNPPAAGDAEVVARMAKIGIVPGQDFDESKLDPEVAKALATVPQAAIKIIMGQFERGGVAENGWVFMTKVGTYGSEYVQRAFVTAVGLGANLPQDAVYPMSVAAAGGQPYSGANRYVMHFAKDQTPPVNAFWSVTMYDPAMFFVPNPLERYSISPRNNLQYNADGSLDLLIQNASPGKDKESNWLPAPAGKFNLMLRMYWPKDKPPSLLDGSWKIPAVTQAK